MVLFLFMILLLVESPTPNFTGILLSSCEKIVNNRNFHTACSRIVKKYLYRRYDKYVIRQTLLMVEGTYTTFNLSSLFPCTLTGNALGTRWWAPPQIFAREGWALIAVSSDYQSDFFKLCSLTGFVVGQCLQWLEEVYDRLLG